MSKIRLNFVSDEVSGMRIVPDWVFRTAPEARALLELLTRCLGIAECLESLC